MSAEPLPDRDDLLEQERQVADAEDEAARLEAENRVIGGEPLATPVTRATTPQGHSARATYRDVDPLVRIERKLHEAEAVVADLAIENAILQTRQIDRTDARNRLLLRVAFALVLVGGDVLVTGSSSAALR